MSNTTSFLPNGLKITVYVFFKKGFPHLTGYPIPFPYNPPHLNSRRLLSPRFAFLVPSGCVDAAAYRDNVWAAEAGTSHEECESQSGRCYWTDGWDGSRRKMRPGICYYSKGSIRPCAYCSMMISLEMYDTMVPRAQTFKTGSRGFVWFDFDKKKKLS